MATKNIPLVIAKPNRGIEAPLKLTSVFAASAAGGDLFRIPRRYPFADITAPAGFFRHNIPQNGSGSAATAVSTELGGVAGANALTTLGYELPPTEKLILLVQKGTAAGTADSFVVKGSLEYRIDDVTVALPSADALGTEYEIDVFNFGLYIGRKVGVGVEEDGIVIAPANAATKFLLVARTA